jgi:hypothetical protein
MDKTAIKTQLATHTETLKQIHTNYQDAIRAFREEYEANCERHRNAMANLLVDLHAETIAAMLQGTMDGTNPLRMQYAKVSWGDKAIADGWCDSYKHEHDAYLHAVNAGFITGNPYEGAYQNAAMIVTEKGKQWLKERAE